MTGPFDALDRSLRDGPPDEVGYRPQPLVTSPGLATDAGGGVVPLGPVAPALPVWRTRTGSPWRYAVTMLVLLGLVGTGIAISSSRVGSNPWTAPAPDFGPLTETFASPRHGFSVRYPEGWTVRPATSSWPQNDFLPIQSPGFDRLLRPGVARLLVASQPLGTGQTEGEWLAAYFHPFEGGQPCGGDQSTWPRLPISGASGYLDADACESPADARVSEPDVRFHAIVFKGGRVYQIGLDGNVDFGYFRAVLAAITLNPSTAVD